MKGSKRYPFHVRIYDPDLCNVLKIMSKKRVVKIPEKDIARRISRKLKPIREDIYIGNDRGYGRSFIGISPDIDIDFEEFERYSDFIFKTLF